MEEEEMKKTKTEMENYFSDKEIEDIVNLAINTGISGYKSALEIRILTDALAAKGIQVNNQMESTYNHDKMPNGTYEFISEIDLGDVSGHCEFCGHPIRYQEWLLHKESNTKFVVGNVCIYKFLGEHILFDIAVSLLKKIKKKLDQIERENIRIKKEEDEKQLQIKICSDPHLEEFLKYKAVQNRNESSFWDNCAEQLYNDGYLTPKRMEVIKPDFDMYRRIRTGDKTLMEGIPSQYQTDMFWLLHHCTHCKTWFFISLAEKLVKFKELTSNQINQMRLGCKYCGSKMS